MIWFLSEIWPRIQAQLGAEVPLTIAGVNNSERIRALGDNSVRVTGHLPDIAALYGGARVFIAPTRYAAGIPHKVHEASARGLPVVTTAILAAQLKWSDGVEIAVAQDAASFAEKCVELHSNKQKWTEIRTAALTAVRRDCSRAVFEARLHRIFAAQPVDEKKKRYADAGMDR
jgi:glycosyltransferase involved in cell wall biosynthesis